MKYISIDIETTGLDSKDHQVLSIGAIIEDTTKKLPLEECPQFHVAILHEYIQGSPYALNMNAELISVISEYLSTSSNEEKSAIEERVGMKFVTEQEAAYEFFKWLYDNGFGVTQFKDLFDNHVTLDNGKMYPTRHSVKKPVSITASGKNFATFDKLFLEHLPHWKELIRVNSRVIDPSILFVKWNEDQNLPSMDQCKRRANLPGPVFHNALQDAWDVIQLLRTAY